MPQISGIFFDAGGTLIFPDPNRISRTFKNIHGDGPSADRWFCATHRATFALDEKFGRGEKALDWWEIYFKEMIKNLGLNKPLKNYKIKEFLSTLYNDHLNENLWCHLAQGALDVVANLKNSGYFLGVISNSDGRVRQQLKNLNLLCFFEFVLDSFVVGCEKPEAKIFEMGLAASNLPAKEVIYVGDFVNIDFVGAMGVGMHPVIIDPLGLRKDKPALPCISSLLELPSWIKKFSLLT